MQETLRAALARGADRAIHVSTEDGLEPLAVAKLLKAVVDKNSADLVFLGKQAIDDDAAQTAPMLAALMQAPQGLFAAKVDVDPAAKAVTVVREIDGGLETLKLQMPAVISADLRLNVPRIATLQAIMVRPSLGIMSLSLLVADVRSYYPVNRRRRSARSSRRRRRVSAST